MNFGSRQCAVALLEAGGGASRLQSPRHCSAAVGEHLVMGSEDTLPGRAPVSISDSRLWRAFGSNLVHSSRPLPSEPTSPRALGLDA